LFECRHSQCPRLASYLLKTWFSNFFFLYIRLHRVNRSIKYKKNLPIGSGFETIWKSTIRSILSARKLGLLRDRVNCLFTTLYAYTLQSCISRMCDKTTDNKPLSLSLGLSLSVRNNGKNKKYHTHTHSYSSLRRNSSAIFVLDVCASDRGGLDTTCVLKNRASLLLPLSLRTRPNSLRKVRARNGNTHTHTHTSQMRTRETKSTKKQWTKR